MTIVDNEDRLKCCFQTVFQNLDDHTLLNMSVATNPAWDSIAAITLLQVVEEEFRVEVDVEKLADLDSYIKWSEYISSALQER